MSPEPSPRTRQALEASPVEGVLAQVTGSIADHYTAPCAIFLGATPAQVGLLAAAPKLLAASAQLNSRRFAEAAGDRRRLLVAGAALQGLALIPVVLAALYGGRSAFVALVLAACAFQFLGGFMYPAWASLMSEYLPPERRAGYFGRRNAIVAAAGLAALAVWGFALDAAGPLRSGAAFAALFSCAALFRLASTRWMLALEPRPLGPEAPSAGWRETLEGPFGRLALYAAFAAFSIQLCDAMQPVRLLSGLGVRYRDFVGIKLAGGTGAALAASWWGRRADRHGTVRVLRAAGALMALAPLAWALTKDLRVLALFELVDGAAAAGFSLCALNRLYETVEPEGRLRAVGLYTVCVGAAVFAAAGLSGLLASRGVSLPRLFMAACALRLAVEASLGARLSGAPAPAATRPGPSEGRPAPACAAPARVR